MRCFPFLYMFEIFHNTKIEKKDGLYIVSEILIIQLHSATAALPKENTQVPRSSRYPKASWSPLQSLSLISHLQSLFKESLVNLPNKAPESSWLVWAPNNASSAEA